MIVLDYSSHFCELKTEYEVGLGKLLTEINFNNENKKTFNQILIISSDDFVIL
jgi:hypothetical protein